MDAERCANPLSPSAPCAWTTTPCRWPLFTRLGPALWCAGKPMPAHNCSNQHTTHW